VLGNKLISRKGPLTQLWFLNLYCYW